MFNWTQNFVLDEMDFTVDDDIVCVTIYGSVVSECALLRFGTWLKCGQVCTSFVLLLGNRDELLHGRKALFSVLCETFVSHNYQTFDFSVNHFNFFCYT